MEVTSGENSVIPTISIRETVIFPDQALVVLKYPPSTALFTKDDINCIYVPPTPSIEGGYENHQIVWCPLQPRGTLVSLAIKHNGNLRPGPIYRWDALAYEAIIDRDNSTIVFVKGLNLRSGRAADPSKFKCLYGWDLTKSKFVLWADVISVAQEIVRCRTPLSVLNSPQRFHRSNFNDSIKVSVRVVGRRTLSSIAQVKHQLSPKPLSRDKQHKMCVCTMLRNQARYLQEWVMYHARIGVQRWFIYDNNSDDELEHVVESLVGANYNVTRHVWPWIKTQEAGFAHCALRARDSCEWVGFIDVDEFFHLPSDFLSLHDVISNQSRLSEVVELRVSCHSFGPSGLKKFPMKGVMAGYTCRLAAPERHKSIVKPEALNSSLINVVHHFHLKSGSRHVNMNKSVLVINHYKYQVWEVFKDKFYRGVATYVSDWQQERNVGSKDRAPGLGTKAVEPSDWSTRFCEIKDTGLRDRIFEIFTDPKTDLFPFKKMLTAEDPNKSPENPENPSKKQPEIIENGQKNENLFSPRFRSVAAMAGWDEEALLIASLIVEDTPDRQFKHKKRSDLQSFKTPPTNSRRKRKAQRRSPASIPVAVLDLDEDETKSKQESEKKNKDANTTEEVEKNRGDDEVNTKGSGVSISSPAIPCLDRLREELSCAICLEICYEPSTTPCGHSFCKNCLRSAADRCGKRCPKCRQLMRYMMRPFYKPTYVTCKGRGFLIFCNPTDHGV
ncbi:hypothetical protein Pfo_009186 [Paulownia fortunei]|nr:hypothetical protein Pfo_009186 [Paulownia fortunei]